VSKRTKGALPLADESCVECPAQVKIEPADAEFFSDTACWRYPPPYDFYDGDQEPVKNPERYFAVRDERSLIGFFYFERKGDTLEYGLGLRPELTGRGFGEEFSRAGLEFGRARFRPKKIILNVAAFNERAIKVYERLGFYEVGRHTRNFKRWGAVEFVEMEERRKAA
jgi:RimJ/RimL family protein N-acetyltransferase